MEKPLFGLSIPFLELLGVEAEYLGDGRAVVSLDVRHDLTNSWEMAHGAVVVALLDVAMAVAARSVNNHAAGLVTVEMSVNFMQAGSGRLTAEGRVMRNGRTLVFCEGEVRDTSNKTIAKSIGTFKLRNRGDGEASNLKDEER